LTSLYDDSFDSSTQSNDEKRLFWKCKYCLERFSKAEEGIEWQIHKIGHKLTELQNEIVGALRGEK
jgi:hypothetical protein